MGPPKSPHGQDVKETMLSHKTKYKAYDDLFVWLEIKEGISHKLVKIREMNPKT